MLRRGAIAALRAPSAAPQRRMIGAGYTGRREKGYDEAAMTALRSLPDQPFFMVNMLKVNDIEMFGAYSAATDGVFKEKARGETVYAGRLRGAPVPVRGDGLDTSEYNVVLLVKYPSIKNFFAFIDSAEYQAHYHLRVNALEDGKSSLVASFPMGGTATEGLQTKVPGSAD